MAELAMTQLAALLERADFVYLTRIQEEERISYRLSLRGASGARHVEREDLAEVLQAALGERSKRCSRCGELKALSQFPCRPTQADGTARDGRAAHCKPCDRLRLAKFYPRANRAGRRLALTGDGAPPPPVA